MDKPLFNELSCIIGAFYEVILIYVYLDNFLGRNSRKYSRIAAFVAVVICNALVNIYTHIPSITLLCGLSAVFLLSLFFNGDWKKKVFVSVLFTAFLAICEMGTLLVLMLIYDTCAHEILQQTSTRFFDIIISKTLLLIVLKAACTWKEKSSVKIPIRYWLSLIFASVISILSVCSIAIVYVRLECTQYQVLSLLALIGLCFTNLLIFYLFEIILRKKELEIHNQLLEQQIQYQINHYEELRISQNELCVFRHDMKNHIFVVTELLKEQHYMEAKEYIEKITHTIQTVGQDVCTGNPVIDSLINAKCSIAKSMGIQVQKTIELPSGIAIDSVDLCIILGNALDNALEACNRIQNDDARYIKIVLASHNENFIFELENSTNGQIKKSGDKFITSKQQKKQHGLGLQNIVKYVQKHQGIVHIQYDNEMHYFQLVVIIPYRDK